MLVIQMIDLDKKFGADRVIDTPVSELACTGAAVGASLCGTKLQLLFIQEWILWICYGCYNKSSI